jgi:hypothetical protein
MSPSQSGWPAQLVSLLVWFALLLLLLLLLL